MKPPSWDDTLRVEGLGIDVCTDISSPICRLFIPSEVSIVSPAARRRVAAGSIILIEDERAIRRAVKKALSPLASRVIEAATGRTAIHFVATTRPALVILDLALPDMDGADVCL